VRSSQSLTGAGFTETASARLDVQNDARLRLEDAVGTLTSTAIASTLSEGRSRTVQTQTPTAARRPTRVTVGDVADILSGVEPPVGAALYDGRPAVFVQVNKLPGVDTVTVTRQVEQAIEDLNSHLTSGSRIE